MSSETTSGRGLSRRALFGAGLGRLARNRLERLERLEDLGALRSSGPPGDEGDATLERLKDELCAAADADEKRPLLRRLEPAAERLVEATAVEAGMRALDVGAGDGNVAAALARRGVVTAACDLSPAMVARGSARTERAGLEVAWRAGDVEALPYADGEFDAVLSAFGAIWAPRTERAVAELTRVCRPGGTVALAAWTPFGFLGRAIALGRQAGGWPAKAQHPERWGRYETAYLHLFGLEELEVEEQELRLPFEDDDELWGLMSSPAGPLGRALRARPERAGDLRAELLDLAAFHAEGDERVRTIPCPYALVTGRRPREGLF